MAYGSSDFGETLEDWTYSELLDDSLAADATSGEYVLPAGATAYVRFFTGSSVTLPYDYEATYLQSTGTQYIDTGLVGAYGDVWQGSFKFDNTSSCFIAGALQESGNTRYTPLQWDGSKFVTVVNGITSAAVTLSADTTTTNKFVASITSGSQVLNVNGSAARATISAALANSNATTYVFARNKGSSVDGCSKIKLFYLKLYRNGVLTLDLVPVVKDGVGCMYNKVDGSLFNNMGSGSFGFDSSTRVSEGGTRLAASAVSKAMHLGTLSVSSIDWDAKEATLSFPALPAAATLWAVYSTSTDPGAFSPNAWNKYEKLADLASGATGGVYGFSYVADSSSDYKSMRFVIAGADDDATLFDYEVKYIESEGTQFIDTGIVGGWNDVWSGRFRFTDTSATGFIAGSRNQSGTRRYSILQWDGTQFVVLADADSTGTIYLKLSGIGTGTDYEFSSAFHYGFQLADVNGTTQVKYAYGAMKNTDTSVHLFHRHGSSSDDGPVKIQMDWFRLVRDGETALDLVPVVKDGEAGFYNKVNGDFLGAATGSEAFDTSILVRSAERTGFSPLMTSFSCSTADTCSFTWTGGAAGAWSDAANWSADGYSQYGYPRMAGVTAVFPSNTSATVTLSEDVSIGTLNVSGAGIGLVFASGSDDVRTLACKDMIDTADDATSLSFDKVAFMPRTGEAATKEFWLASGSSLAFLPGASNTWTRALQTCTTNDSTAYFRGETDFRPGSFHITSGSSAFLCVGGEGVLRIGGTVSVYDVTYAYFSMGGGTIQIYGDSPSLKVSRSFRAKLKGSGVTRNVDSNLEFLLPQGGWGSESAVIKGASSNSDYAFGGTDGNLSGLNLKLKISVPDESPAFSASQRTAARGNHLLIDWPAGINTNAVELVTGGRNGQTLFYTWSRDPADKTPPAESGLPQYLWVRYTPRTGMMLIVR